LTLHPAGGLAMAALAPDGRRAAPAGLSRQQGLRLRWL